MRVAHVIVGLGVGGAENLLAQLLPGMLETDQFVISLTDEGKLGDALRSRGISVSSVGMAPKASALLGGARGLRRELHRVAPDLVHSWMYHANLMTALALPDRRIPAIWSLHHPGFGRGLTKPATTAVAKVGSFLSRWASSAIVTPTQQVANAHVARGYPSWRMVVIPNGVDVERFGPAAHGGWLREDLGIPAEGILIGFIGRSDPLKDFQSFLEAGSELVAARPELHLVVCGGEEVNVVPEELRGRLHVLGWRSDLERVMPQLDLVVMTSRAEAFGMTLLEAGACAVPCVSTDVGVASSLLDPSCVVPPGDARALYGAMEAVLDLSPEERGVMGSALRRRVTKDYAIDEVSARYLDLYRRVAG